MYKPISHDLCYKQKLYYANVSGDKYKLTSSQEEATKLVQIASKSVDDHSNKKYFEKSNTNNGVVPSLSRGKLKTILNNI